MPLNIHFCTHKSNTFFLIKIETWQLQDKKTLKKVNQLLKNIERSNFEGLGKPEALKGNLSGFWSRRIDDANRLIYRINDEFIDILSCKGHYENV
ncbi:MULTISPECIES: Txe/YoeB family addiction module toxin [unclassified Fibrobacter]|uniref:Txe/YoeB family addiction module toxin n=1 Tax=unclassified Fibrobacter TaxID=2634177 RepID=UPI0025B7BB2C|nr:MULTISPECIES: Txe/YoeB family addiction module toxin [unclassified Fibrobacter]